MKNITNKTQTILFASLIAAMILPFSMMNVASAEISDDTTEKLLKLFERGNAIQAKIQELQTKLSETTDEEKISKINERLQNLEQRAATIDAKINELAPITEEIQGTTVQTITSQSAGVSATTSSSGSHTIVNQSASGCGGNPQSYSATMSINPVTDTSYWNIAYTDPIKIGFWPACFNTSWSTYEVIVQNHSAGWLCAANNITGATSSFAQTCTGKNMSSGDLLKVDVIAHYAQWQISHTKYVVV